LDVSRVEILLCGWCGGGIANVVVVCGKCSRPESVSETQS
jgi:hypothetical protein